MESVDVASIVSTTLKGDRVESGGEAAVLKRALLKTLGGLAGEELSCRQFGRDM